MLLTQSSLVSHTVHVTHWNWIRRKWSRGVLIGSRERINDSWSRSQGHVGHSSVNKDGCTEFRRCLRMTPAYSWKRCNLASWRCFGKKKDPCSTTAQRTVADDITRTTYCALHKRPTFLVEDGWLGHNVLSSWNSYMYIRPCPLSRFQCCHTGIGVVDGGVYTIPLW